MHKGLSQFFDAGGFGLVNQRFGFATRYEEKKQTAGVRCGCGCRLGVEWKDKTAWSNGETSVCISTGSMTEKGNSCCGSAKRLSDWRGMGSRTRGPVDEKNEATAARGIKNCDQARSLSDLAGEPNTSCGDTPLNSQEWSEERAAMTTF